MEGVKVMVGVSVWVGVGVLVGVAEAVEVAVGVGVCVGLGVLVGVFDAAMVAVCVGDAATGLQAVTSMTAKEEITGVIQAAMHEFSLDGWWDYGYPI